MQHGGQEIPPSIWHSCTQAKYKQGRRRKGDEAFEKANKAESRQEDKAYQGQV